MTADHDPWDHVVLCVLAYDQQKVLDVGAKIGIFQRLVKQGFIDHDHKVTERGKKVIALMKEVLEQA